MSLVQNTVPTYAVTIFIAGDATVAKHVCQEFCMQVGLCVTVEQTTYVYTGGAEDGVRVGLINYPRFPAEPDAILEKATALANLLRSRLYQHSWTILTPTETIWDSTRAT